jgi:hypothetical protein
MPARPKLAAKAAGNFPTFDELAADAREVSPEDPYLLPLPGGDVIEIRLNGDQYLTLTRAQLRGDYETMFETLFPDAEDRALVRIHFRKAPALMADRLIGNVLSYFYGNGLQIEAAKGNSPAS